MKLGVCIPYRDNGDGVRKKHLDTLVPHLEEFFKKKNIEFRCYIGHQVDDKKFNRSGTKNVAYLAATLGSYIFSGEESSFQALNDSSFC